MLKKVNIHIPCLANCVNIAILALERWVDHPLTMQGNDFYLGVAQRILRIDHPSVEDLKQTVKSLNEDRREIRTKRFWECKEQVDKGEDGWLPRSQRALYHHWLDQVHEIEERRAPFQKMLDNGSYYLGHVVAGTGMNRTRVNKDGLRVSVDWALIKISNNRIHKQTHGEDVSGNEVSLISYVSFHTNTCIPSLSHMKETKCRSNSTTIQTWNLKKA